MNNTYNELALYKKFEENNLQSYLFYTNPVITNLNGSRYCVEIEGTKLQDFDANAPLHSGVALKTIWGYTISWTSEADRREVKRATPLNEMIKQSMI
jgi:hypothetical protein